MSGFGNIGPFSTDEIEARHNHIQSLSGKDEQLSDRDMAIAYEAFMTGRVYARLGEKESPADIHEKLIQNCKQAVMRVEHE